jgi:DNA-binding NtrC family response regulator
MNQRAILVADDQDDLREILRIKLTAAGHRVVTAANGHEASEAFAREEFDLVVTDLLMPEKDGIELICELRQIRPKLPIIAMTGGGQWKNSFDFLKLARALGSIAILEKPFKDADLMKALALAIPAADCKKNP